jgi:pyruvate formate-lyase activating enzyme-like uncharacterized protein
MKQIKSWKHESVFLPPLSPACQKCAEGSKLVILVTGLCPRSCYYCPLSFKKGGKDRIFADEWELDNERDNKKLIQEAKYIDAKGAGITGGDPLLVWDRVKTYLLNLKDTFGDKFHIHLYTSGQKNETYIPDLVHAGLDEIRFHPSPSQWSKMDHSPIKKGIKIALDTGADVAIEIPVLPQMGKDIFSLISWAETQELQWINLNELEFSERNCNALLTKGYQVKDDISAAVKGSQETALQLLQQTQQYDYTIGVHYCSVSFKDGVQLRNRIHRRAVNIAKDYEIISDDGTLIKGIITSPMHSLQHLYLLLQHQYNVPKRYLSIDKEKQRIEIGAWLLETLAPKLKKQRLSCYLIEEYPTADRLEVERISLPPAP